MVFEELSAKLERWGEELVPLLPNLAVAVLVLIIAWLAALLASKAAARLLSRVSDHEALNEIIRKLVRFAVMVAGLLIALNVLQLDEAATTFLAGAGIVGLALGFAFQDITANFIAGVAMAIKRPMRIGDLIETNDVTGTVKQIELRSTWLETLDGRIVMIPNRKIYEEKLSNLSRKGERRMELQVGVSYGDDLAVVKKVATAALETVQPRLDRPVDVFFQAFGESSVDFCAHVWIPFRTQRDMLAAQSAAVMAIHKAFGENGITIPFPIRTLDFGIPGGTPLREELEAAARPRKAS